MTSVVPCGVPTSEDSSDFLVFFLPCQSCRIFFSKVWFLVALSNQSACDIRSELSPFPWLSHIMIVVVRSAAVHGGGSGPCPLSGGPGVHGAGRGGRGDDYIRDLQVSRGRLFTFVTDLKTCRQETITEITRGAITSIMETNYLHCL